MSALTRGAVVGPPPRIAADGLSGEERLLREILLFDPVTSEPGPPSEIQRSLPSGFPRDLLPPASAGGVVAATVAPDQMTVVVIASTLPLASASKFVRGLAATGWLPGSPPVGGFFRPSSVYGLACRGPQAAQFRFVSRASGGTYVRASVSTGRCGRAAGSPFLDVAMPMLAHPPGASVPSVPSGGGLDSHHWGVRVTSGLAWSELVTYYASQMSASEWPAGGRVADSELVVTRHRSTTTAGEPVHAILTLFKVPGEPTVDAWLRVVRLAPR